MKNMCRSLQHCYTNRDLGPCAVFGKYRRKKPKNSAESLSTFSLSSSTKFLAIGNSRRQLSPRLLAPVEHTETTTELPIQRNLHRTAGATCFTTLLQRKPPGGPGGQVLGKVESGTHVRVIRLDPIYGNVQVRAPNGITGWISIGDVSY
jgi:hypothetical protein